MFPTHTHPHILLLYAVSGSASSQEAAAAAASVVELGVSSEGSAGPSLTGTGHQSHLLKMFSDSFSLKVKKKKRDLHRGTSKGTGSLRCNSCGLS